MTIKIPITRLLISKLLAAGLLAVAIPLSAVFAAETQTFEHRTEVARPEAMTHTDNKTLVIYFSRSGNTEAMAEEIASYYQAQLVQLEAADYRPGFRGLVNAVKDSRSDHTLITPATFDLSPYETIFIGVPIWWSSPAPPVWQFIHNNDVNNKNIVLFTTFNSSFKQHYIDEFQTLTENQGGRFIKHIYVKRGRMMRQINAETLLKKTRKELDSLPLQ